MNSIEVLAPAIDRDATALAYTLFDEVIAPAAAERIEAGTSQNRDMGHPAPGGYFPVAFEPERSTYFLQPSAPQLTPADFDFPGGGDADGLIEALVAYWTQEGENQLASSGQLLKETIAALRSEAVESDGNVDPYCYTMF